MRILIAWAFIVYNVINVGYRVAAERVVVPSREICEAERRGAAEILGALSVSDRCEEER